MRDGIRRSKFVPVAHAGSLELGRPADFFTVDLNDCSLAGSDRDSLLGHVVFSLANGPPSAMSSSGANRSSTMACHRLQEEIVRDFAKVQRNLWR